MELLSFLSSTVYLWNDKHVKDIVSGIVRALDDAELSITSVDCKQTGLPDGDAQAWKYSVTIGLIGGYFITASSHQLEQTDPTTWINFNDDAIEKVSSAEQVYDLVRSHVLEPVG